MVNNSNKKNLSNSLVFGQWPRTKMLPDTISPIIILSVNCLGLSRWDRRLDPYRCGGWGNGRYLTRWCRVEEGSSSHGSVGRGEDHRAEQLDLRFRFELHDVAEQLLTKVDASWRKLLLNVTLLRLLLQLMLLRQGRLLLLMMQLLLRQGLLLQMLLLLLLMIRLGLLLLLLWQRRLMLLQLLLLMIRLLLLRQRRLLLVLLLLMMRLLLLMLWSWRSLSNWLIGFTCKGQNMVDPPCVSQNFQPSSETYGSELKRAEVTSSKIKSEDFPIN